MNLLLIIWYATAGNRGPYHIWENDTEEDKEHWKEIIGKENAKRAYHMTENQGLAHKEGTWQQKALDEFNQSITGTGYWFRFRVSFDTQYVL